MTTTDPGQATRDDQAVAAEVSARLAAEVAATEAAVAARPATAAEPFDRPARQPLELRTAQPPLLYRTLLRYGVAPLFLGLDVAAWAAASALTGWRALDAWLLVAVLALYAAHGLYRSRLSLSSLDDAAGLAGRALAAGAFVLAVDAVVADGTPPARLMAAAGVLAVLAVLLRAAGYRVVRLVRRRGWIGHPTLVLGAGKVGKQVVGLLLDHPEYGLRPVGFLDRDPLLAPDERPVPLLGSDAELASAIVEFGVRDVVVAFGALPESALVEVIRTCDRLDVEIFFVPRLFELHETNRVVDQVWGLPLVRLRRAAFRTWQWKSKRVVDVLLSGAALLVLSPLMGAVALAVRLEGGPGIIFKQTRVGLDGRPFEVMKFRSMRPVDETESQTQWSIAQDDRVGRVGRFIRATSLDELPQLINILRGDMSVVGPRPERPHFVETFTATYPRYTARHRVPAGLTGWAAVHGLRGDTSIEERARFDNYYIENWSLWLDLKIIAMTVAAVLRRTGSG